MAIVTLGEEAPEEATALVAEPYGVLEPDEVSIVVQSWIHLPLVLLEARLEGASRRIGDLVDERSDQSRRDLAARFAQVARDTWE